MSALHENYKCYDNLLLMGGLLKIEKKTLAFISDIFYNCHKVHKPFRLTTIDR